MIYEYDGKNLEGIVARIEDEDIVQMKAEHFLRLAGVYNKPKGRKPISLDENKFASVVAMWRNGEMTARAAMNELDLKPNTFYRRVKEYTEMTDLKEIKEIKKAIKEETKEIKATVKAEEKELKKQLKKDAKIVEETISAKKMEKET